MMTRSNLALLVRSYEMINDRGLGPKPAPLRGYDSGGGSAAPDVIS